MVRVNCGSTLGVFAGMDGSPGAYTLFRIL